MTRRILTAIILSASGLGAVSADAANLVANGSFESGLAGWTISGSWESPYAPAAIFYNSTAGYPVGAFSEPVPQNNAPTNSPDGVGERAAYFVADNAVNQTLSQVFTVGAGQGGLYQVGFSAYAPLNGFNNANDATFTATIAGNLLASYSVKSGVAQVWTTYASSGLLLAEGTHTVEFVFNSNGYPAADVVIDQVYVIKGDPPSVPLPAAAWLLLSGLGGLGFLGRRKAAS